MYYNDRYTLRGTSGRHTASQVFDIEDVFAEYFSKAIIPDQIIELGTDNGSFSNIIYKLRKQINDDFYFISYDVKPRPEELNKGIIHQQINVFDHIDEIGNLIMQNTLVLCDNGNKVEEVWKLVPYLEKNCVIMAHDYFYDAPTFYIESCWPVCEIEFAQVAPLVKTYGLKRYLPEIMDKGLWLSLIKE